MIWQSVASSADGAKLVAAGYSPNTYLGVIYTSTNSGVFWAQTGAPTNQFVSCWSCVASSADGSKLAAAPVNGYIYTSTNSGATWTQTQAQVSDCVSLVSSTTGFELMEGDGSCIWSSIDFGTSWIQTIMPPPYNGIHIALSTDGTRAVAASYGGGIYTAQATIQTTTTPGPAGYLAGGQNSAIELQYIGNGQFMPLSYVGPISAY
jgi:hypothetical protein